MNAVSIVRLASLSSKPVMIEPVKVGYYKEDSLGDIAERCLGDKSTFKGDISQYYLEGVIDGGNPQNWSKKDIPTDIYNKLTKSG